MTSPTPKRRTERLHFGRISRPHARYFVTFVTAGRSPWLATESTTSRMLEILQQWHREGDGCILSAVVMPDHVHVLFELGKKLTVGRCVSRWKAALLRTSPSHAAWQRDFWEHHVRASKSVEEFGLYMFLNPYRSGLIQPGNPWGVGWMPDPSIFEFTGKLDPEGGPPREWIEASLKRLVGLQVGE